MAGQQETSLRIVLLGKSGDGKSSAGNTILGDDVFTTSNAANSETGKCQSGTDRKKRFTITDTPGLFDTKRCDEDVKKEIMRCIIECAPGPHAFLIVLRVGRYTEHEQETVKKLLDLFGKKALKYTIVVFTRGDDLDQNQQIEDFVQQNDKLKSFVDKCGGRCHVIDNKYWKEKQDEYRNNRVQVEKIINTIQTMVKNGEDFYSNDMMNKAQARILKEEQKLRDNTNTKLSNDEICTQAKESVFTFYLLEIAKVGLKCILDWLLGE